MKYLAATIALVFSTFATVATAGDTSLAYRNWGQCNSALAQAITDDRKSLKADDGAMTGYTYVGHLSCVKIGDFWYIIPHA